MNAIEIGTRTLKNLVVSNDKLLVMDAIELGEAAAVFDVSVLTKYLYTPTASARVLHISSDVDVIVAVGIGVTIDSTPVHVLKQEEHHNLVVRAGAKMVLQKHGSGVGATNQVHISELL